MKPPMNGSKGRFTSRMWIVALSCLMATRALSSAAPTAADTRYLHSAWQYEEGLPQNAVQSVIQTRDGYLWVGTQRGLARFDGVHFTHFNPANTPEIKSAQSTGFCETKDG